MKHYSRDLHFDAVVPKVKARDRKNVLQHLSKHAAKALNISEKLLFDMLLEKEMAASSGVGGGIAIPQLQIRGPRKPFTMLATLDSDIQFDAIDSMPVNLACLVLSPSNEGPHHLRRLSRISRLLQNETLHKRLTDAEDEETMRSLLIDPEGWLLAA